MANSQGKGLPQEFHYYAPKLNLQLFKKMIQLLINKSQLSNLSNKPCVVVML